VSTLDSIRWWHRIDLGNGVITPGECSHTEADATPRFGIPEDLTGKTVLDIGAWDGLFSFVAEKRGAAGVLAVDVPESEGGHWGGRDGFIYACTALQSKIAYREWNIERYLSWSFDIVFCFGVLYHVKDIIRSCENLAKATKEYALIETAYAQGTECSLEYRPGHVGDDTNYLYPTIPCLEAMLIRSGFKKVHLVYQDPARLTLKAFK
jgi:tRNA (mo5U34)-methyltransferase